MKGNNKYGAAGKGGVPAGTLVAFLDAYTYEGHNPSIAPVDGENVRARRINGIKIPAPIQRSIRRWRNGQVERVSTRGLCHVLDTFGFTLPWFHQWAKLHRKPVK